jgi:hypothetical protein
MNRYRSGRGYKCVAMSLMGSPTSIHGCVWHSDISCRNLMLSDGYRIKIGDFGGSIITGRELSFRPLWRKRRSTSYRAVDGIVVRDRD